MRERDGTNQLAEHNRELTVFGRILEAINAARSRKRSRAYVRQQRGEYECYLEKLP